MGNSYFRFKQFAINQDKTAMKVGVDGVILGAWIKPGKTVNILDIGTGTGLLSLMLAQKSNAEITAIEIEKEAYFQALTNVENSKWSERIEVIHCSFQNFADKPTKKYDLIVCNPPYFTKSLTSQDKLRRLARHDDLLPLNELFPGVKKVLTANGRFYMIYPFDKKELVIKTANSNGLYANKIMNIKGTELKAPNRFTVEFGSGKSICAETSLIVRDSKTNDYTEAYKILTKDYYLAF